MKKRVQMDSSLLSVAILLTGVLYRFPHWYPQSEFWNHFLVFFGTLIILKGIFLRMAARGHKKAHSQEGHGLVMTGLYAYMRNPMYLGSFLVGAGFLLVAWPWWLLPVYVGIFYWRFIRQVIKEETHLQKVFGKAYADYCQRVPRFIPSWERLMKMDFQHTCPKKEVWSTKEKRTLYGWPVLVVIIGSLKQKIVFGRADIGMTLALVGAALAVFFLGLWVRYESSGSRHAKHPA